MKFEVILQLRVFCYRKSTFVTLNHFKSLQITFVTPIPFITLFMFCFFPLKGILKRTWYTGGISLEKLYCILLEYDTPDGRDIPSPADGWWPSATCPLLCYVQMVASSHLLKVFNFFDI